MRNPFKKKVKVVKPELECYETLEIWLYNWNQYMITNDNNWFIKSYTGREPKIQSEYLDKLETKLNDDYFELLDDKNYRELLEKRLKIMQITNRHTKIYCICERIRVGFNLSNQNERYKYIKLLEEEGFTIPEINSWEGDIECVDEIMKEAGQLKTQIAILSKDLKDNSSQVKTSIEKQLIYLCLGLEMKLLKTKEISVIEWVELTKILKEKNEALKEAQEKMKNKNNDR